MSNVKVITKFNTDHIQQDVMYEDALGNVTQMAATQIVKLQDEGVRQALIKLGWTPPDDNR